MMIFRSAMCNWCGLWYCVLGDYVTTVIWRRRRQIKLCSAQWRSNEHKNMTPYSLLKILLTAMKSSNLIISVAISKLTFVSTQNMSPSKRSSLSLTITTQCITHNQQFHPADESKSGGCPLSGVVFLCVCVPVNKACIPAIHFAAAERNELQFIIK